MGNIAFYELVTLQLGFGGAVKAPTQVRTYDQASAKSLLGMWRPEFGAQNALILLRGFKSIEALLSERQRIRLDSNPFGCGASLLRMELQTFAPVPGFDGVEAGNYGPLYELRSYGVHPGRLGDIVAEWSAIKPARDAISKMLLVMYAVDGPDRLVHLWPYASLEDRTRARQEAWTHCPGWPPPSGMRSLDPLNMQSTLLFPTDESPLT